MELDEDTRKRVRRINEVHDALEASLKGRIGSLRRELLDYEQMLSGLKLSREELALATGSIGSRVRWKTKIRDKHLQKRTVVVDGVVEDVKSDGETIKYRVRPLQRSIDSITSKHGRFALEDRARWITSKRFVEEVR